MFQQSNDSSFEVDTGEITGVNVVTTSPGLSFCTDRQYSTNIDSEYIYILTLTLFLRRKFQLHDPMIQKSIQKCYKVTCERVNAIIISECDFSNISASKTDETDVLNEGLRRRTS